MRGYAPLVLAALLGACEPARFVAAEPWATPPDVRVMVLFSSEEPVTLSAAGSAPFELTLEPEVEASIDRGEGEVWVFGWSLAALASEIPGFEGLTAEQAAAAMRPLIGASPDAIAAPPSAEVLTGSIEPQIRYRAAGWAGWESDRAGKRRDALSLQLPPAVLCGAVKSTIVRGPPSLRLDAVAATGDGSALLSGTAATSARGMVQLAALEGDRMSRLGEIPHGGPTRGGISWNSVADELWGVGAEGNIFRTSSTGVSLPVPQLPFPGDFGQALDVEVGVDGQVLAHNQVQDPARNWLKSGFLMRFDAQQQAWVDHGDRDRAVSLVRPVRSNRVFAFSACWLSYFDGAWAIELFDKSCVTARGEPVLIRDVAADADTAAAVGDAGYVALRNESTKEWLELPPPNGDSRAVFRTVATFGEGRLIVGSEEGLLTVWTGERWCPVPAGSSAAVLDVSASRSGRTAFALLDAPSGASPVVVVDLREVR